MNDCCEKWQFRSIDRLEVTDKLDMPVIIKAYDTFTFCPECGTRLKEPVACRRCRFFISEIGTQSFLRCECAHPKNLRWRDVFVALRSYDEINANNDCPWYEAKEG